MRVVVASERSRARAAAERVHESVWLPSHDVDRVLNTAFVLAAVAVVAQTVAHFTNALAFDYRYFQMDADQDGNAVSWASSVATFAVAFCAVLLGLLARDRAWRFFAFAVVIGFFSLDDSVTIHEQIASWVTRVLGIEEIFSRVLWPTFYLPLLVFAGVTLWRLAAPAPDRIRRTIWLGLALLATALAAELVSVLWSHSDPTHRTLVDDVEVAVEEGAELAAWIVLAAALAGLLVDHVARAAGPMPPPEPDRLGRVSDYD
jgi:hypothetical protein